MATFTKRIDSNIRDVDNMLYEGSWLVDINSALSLGNPGLVTRNISLRFTGINIPQGATINSAKITFRSTSSGSSLNVNLKIEGVDEDNTSEFVASPEDTARTRTKTTAYVSWNVTSQTSGSDIDTPNIGTIVKEIVDRGSWSSGNAMAFWISENGSTSGHYIDVQEYNGSTSLCALLTIDYVEPGSPSPSPSPSVSMSLSPSLSTSGSPSATASPSASVSPSTSISLSPSASTSPSPSAIEPFFGLKIAKPGKNVLTTDDPRDLIFSSDYGTLKYFETGDLTITLNGVDNGTTSYTHNLNYYPYFEVYLLNPLGEWEYCPTVNGGATTTWTAYVLVTTTELKVYILTTGFTESTEFKFKYFIYKNDLKLS